MKIKISFILLILSYWGLWISIYGSNQEMHYRLKAADLSLSNDERLLYIDSIINESPAAGDSLLLVAAELALSSCKYDKAVKNMETLISKYQSNKSLLSIDKYCLALYTLANAYFKNTQYAEGIETALRLLHFSKPESLVYHDINCLTLLIEYCTTSKSDSSLVNINTLQTYIKRAEDLLKHSEDLNMSPKTLDDMRKAILFSKMLLAMNDKEFEVALKWGATVLHYPITPVEKIALEGNLALMYFEMGNYPMAEEHYRKVLSEQGWHPNHANILGNYMYLLTERGEAEKALDLWKSHPEIVELVKKTSTYAYILNRLSYALLASDNIEDSYRAYLRRATMNDSINNIIQESFSNKLIDTIEQNYSSEEIIKKNKFTLKIIIIITIALLIIITVLIIKIVILHRKNTIRLVKDDSKSERADSQITHILKLGCLNEVLTDVKNTLDNSADSDHDKILQIQNLLKEISMVNDTWDIFSSQFEKIHPSFFKILKNQHPEITKGEMKMCAYIMLNMSNKEIAILTRRSIRGVETMRYRISKKLPLMPEDTLMTY